MNASDPSFTQAERPIDRLVAHYGLSHQHPTNELIHFVAIPLIMLSIVGLIYALHPWVAYAFVAASLVYYARLGSHVVLACMGVWTVLLLALIWLMGASVLRVCVALFVFGWVIQFIGHKIEGKKPSFFEDLQYLWIGPVFVLTRLFKRLGLAW